MDYEKIAVGREYFGDFDLLLEADKLNIKIVKITIKYQDVLMEQLR